MKYLKLYLILLLIIITYNIYPKAILNKENLKVEIKEIKYEIKNNYLDINISIPKIIGIENKNQEEVINNKIKKSTEDLIDEFKKVADEYFKDKIEPSNPYTLYSTYKITNNDDIISFYIDYYQFSGGAHGITNKVAYNIEKTTGKELKLKDIFKEGYKYKEAIDNEIIKQINKEKDKYFTKKDGFNGIDENQKFYIKDDSIIIYFDLYEIAPYAAGIPEFIISNNLFKGNLKYSKIE